MFVCLLCDLVIAVFITAWCPVSLAMLLKSIDYSCENVNQILNCLATNMVDCVISIDNVLVIQLA